MREQRLERRVVTALFVDVVGSTTLTLALGPERVKRALDRTFAELATLIAAEGGTVEKYIGDAIHALFGVPATHPDDPQRALRAAHACVEWAAAARAHASVPLEVRAGVETGEAIIDLAATETERQQMSIGACVNVAARLQQVAEPGQVVVGPTCREANTEVAEFIGLGDVDLKGLGRLPAWRLVAFVRPRAGGRVPFVGREPELGLLRLAYARARSGRGVLAFGVRSPWSAEVAAGRRVHHRPRAAGGQGEVSTGWGTRSGQPAATAADHREHHDVHGGPGGGFDGTGPRWLARLLRDPTRRGGHGAVPLQRQLTLASYTNTRDLSSSGMK